MREFFEKKDFSLNGDFLFIDLDVFFGGGGWGNKYYEVNIVYF